MRSARWVPPRAPRTPWAPRSAEVAATPGLGTGSSPVTVSATASDAQTGGADVVAAEYFVDAIGADGSGTAIPVGAPAPAVSLSTDLSPALLASLAQGAHTVWLHAQDAAGNWGGAVSAGFVLDGVAPTVTMPTAGPSPTLGATSVEPLGPGCRDRFRPGPGRMVRRHRPR